MKLLKSIDKVIGLLNNAWAKLGMAENAYRRHRESMGINMLTLATSLHGIPYTYRDMAHIYESSAEKDVRKSMDLIRKLENKLRDGAYTPVITGLEEAQNILLQAYSLPGIDERRNKIRGALEKLYRVRDYIQKYHLDE